MSHVWVGLFCPKDEESFVWMSDGKPEQGYIRTKSKRFSRHQDLYTYVRVDQENTFNMVIISSGEEKISLVCEYVA